MPFYVPSELVANILSRLPVKPLGRFKCVSKPWLALIESPDFIKLHLNHSILTNSHRHLIGREDDDDCNLYSLELDCIQNLTQLHHPLKPGTQILGSSNGLLCLHHSDNEIVFYNPSTTSHHKLPPTNYRYPHPDVSGRGHYFSYSFGYDEINDDYKLLRMLQTYNFDATDSFQSQAELYSFNSRSWTTLLDFPYFLYYPGAYGMFASGAFHWVVTRTPWSDRRTVIAALDLATQKSQLVPLPDLCLGTDFEMNVEALGGCLSLICNFYLRNVDIWVMKDYGVKESWTKLISLPQPNDVRYFLYASPIAYSNNGERVLLEMDKGFVWYHLKRKEVETVTVGGLPSFLDSYVYVESLVKLPDGGSEGKNLPFLGKRKKSQKKRKQVPKKRQHGPQA